jgi:hypothetical protein
MRVDLEVSLCFDGQPKPAVFGDLLEHVIEERNPGRDGRLAAIELERDDKFRLGRVARDARAPVRHGPTPSMPR